MVQEKINGNFIPAIPWEWIKKLQAPIGGYTFRVALYIWYQKGVKKSRKDLIISISGINNFFRIDRKAFNRAIHELESLGMIGVERHTGRSPRVTIEFGENVVKN